MIRAAERLREENGRRENTTTQETSSSQSKEPTGAVGMEQEYTKLSSEEPADHTGSKDVTLADGARTMV